jgi:hypothetical protein
MNLFVKTNEDTLNHRIYGSVKNSSYEGKT